MSHPRPGPFPIPFEEALRLAVGGRHRPDRYSVFRQFWRSELLRMAAATGLGPPVDNTDRVIARFKASGVTRLEFESLRSGVSEWRKAHAQAQRSAAARTRWSKPKPRKPIDRGSKRRK